MPTPYDLYVRFLVTKGDDSPGAVNVRLAELNLAEIEPVHFDAQDCFVAAAVPKGIVTQIEKKSYGADFLKWMEVIQLREFWSKDKDDRSLCKLVLDIHQDLSLRTTINALLVKGVLPRDVIQAVNGKYSTLLREHHIAAYEKYFFNPRQMTRTAWKKYLRLVTKKEAAVYFTALSEPLDVVKTELELPAKISSAESLQYLATKVFLKAKHALGNNTPAGDENARKWVNAYLNVTDKYEKFRTGDQADFGRSLQMEFEFVDDEFMSPDTEVLKEITDKQRRDESVDEKIEVAEVPPVEETPP